MFIKLSFLQTNEAVGRISGITRHMKAAVAELSMLRGEAWCLERGLATRQLQLARYEQNVAEGRAPSPSLEELWNIEAARSVIQRRDTVGRSAVLLASPPRKRNAGLPVHWTLAKRSNSQSEQIKEAQLSLKWLPNLPV